MKRILKLKNFGLNKKSLSIGATSFFRIQTSFKKFNLIESQPKFYSIGKEERMEREKQTHFIKEEKRINDPNNFNESILKIKEGWKAFFGINEKINIKKAESLFQVKKKKKTSLLLLKNYQI